MPIKSLLDFFSALVDGEAFRCKLFCSKVEIIEYAAATAICFQRAMMLEFMPRSLFTLMHVY